MSSTSPKASKVKNIINFLQADIWRIRASKLSGQKLFWIRQLRIFLLAIRGFAEDKCQLRASALTFFSLLSIVPVVAMVFGIAKGFGFEKMMEKQILKNFQGQEEVGGQIIEFANSFLENSQGGMIAGIGIIVLFWSVIKVLGNIENSFNDIWGIKKGRTFGRKLSDYLSIMMICPVLLIMSSSLTALLVGLGTVVVDKLSFLGPVASLVLMILNLLPYAVLWILFTFVYMFMPNTKVNLKSALFAGVISGTIYQIVQFIYLNFQVGVSKYGAIYGSFAALPLFLIWLQLSWLIVLFGAEFSFAEQNVETYEFEPDCLSASASFKRTVALAITQHCVKKFHEYETPSSADDISHAFDLPIRLVREILFELTESGVLNEVKPNGDNLVKYQPAKSIENLSLHDVINSLDHHGNDNVPVRESNEMQSITAALKKFDDLIHQSSENILMKDI